MVPVTSRGEPAAIRRNQCRGKEEKSPGDGTPREPERIARTEPQLWLVPARDQRAPRKLPDPLHHAVGGRLPECGPTGAMRTSSIRAAAPPAGRIARALQALSASQEHARVRRAG